MPEAPEIEALSIVLNKLGFQTKRHGKHLFIDELLEDWHFGLRGRVKIAHTINSGGITTYNITKYSNAMSGLVRKVDSFDEMVLNHLLGIDWLTATPAELESVINVWKTRGRVLGSILLDQSEICGIGVAWGSEICHRANVHPGVKANAVNLDGILPAMLEIRREIMATYNKFLRDQQDLCKFVEEWFLNLYKIREMKAYKKGKSVDVASRTWWVVE